LSIKKALKAIALLLLLNPLCQAQRFSSVVFSKLPQDYQLYPRNTENESVVPISGIVETAGWNYISVQMLSFGITREDFQKSIRTFNHWLPSERLDLMAYTTIGLEINKVAWSFRG
jgi:hypothetical protein